MANAIQYLNTSRRRGLSLRCKSSTDRSSVAAMKPKSSVSKSERTIACPYEKNSTKSRKLMLEETWNDSAAHTLDLLDSSFGRFTPPSSVDAHDTESSRSHETSVRWSTIEIHVHEKVLGDNVPSSGPPVGIGWHAEEHLQLSIDDYEQQRPPRRIRMEMLTPSRSRQDELMESGLSFRELREACSEAATVRRQRQKECQGREIGQEHCKVGFLETKVMNLCRLLIAVALQAPANER